MNIRIELKYAMLITLLLLLWLAFEFMIGIQDRYIAWYPYATILSFFIPIGATRQAMVAKREMLHGEMPFKKAFITGLTIAGLTAVFAIPSQLVFHYIINPDFFEDMIQYAVAHGHSTSAQAAQYYNLRTSLIEGVVGSLLLGSLIAGVMAYFMRTKNQ